jgi:hypothetical protein
VSSKLEKSGAITFQSCRPCRKWPWAVGEQRLPRSQESLNNATDILFYSEGCWLLEKVSLGSQQVVSTYVSTVGLRFASSSAWNCLLEKLLSNAIHATLDILPFLITSAPCSTLSNTSADTSLTYADLHQPLLSSLAPPALPPPKTTSLAHSTAPNKSPPDPPTAHASPAPPQPHPSAQ